MLRTSHINALTQSRLTLDHFYVSCPTCMPNRAALMICTEDRGDLVGDHGLMLKYCFHYESLIQAPFVWHDPDAAKQVSSRPRGTSSSR